MAHRTVEQDQRWNVAPGKLPLRSREVDSQAFVDLVADDAHKILD